MGRAARLSELPATSWTLLAAAREEGDAARRALDEFARRYHAPVVAFVDALVRDEEQANDLTQSFFASRVLTGRLFAQANAARGSFRPYLKRAVRNYVLDALRGRLRARRTGEADALPLDAIPESGVADPSPRSRPDRAFHLAWARGLLEQALMRVRRRCEERGQQAHFEIFSMRYLDPAGSTPSWSDLGARHGLDEKAARGRAETVTRVLRAALLEILTLETGSRRTAEAEIATLGVLLAGEDP